jgi:S-adenosylmethionine/arginine decarboxylase-like enzyme
MLEYRKGIAKQWPHFRRAPELCPMSFNHQLLELTEVNPAKLQDGHALSALLVSAAGAVGMPSLGPPVVREGAGVIAVALLCLEGHIVLHGAPSEGVCLVEIIARAPADVSKGIGVIRRRLAS